MITKDNIEDKLIQYNVHFTPDLFFESDRKDYVVMDYGKPAKPNISINSNNNQYTKLDSMMKGLLEADGELTGLSRQYLADDDIRYKLTLYQKQNDR